MPNLCSFEMRAIGSRDSINKFQEIVFADYTYIDDALDNCNADHHLFRTWAESYDIEELDENKYIININGDCAWSVEVCMFDCAPLGYYNQLKNNKGFKGITLPLISEKYEIDIEVYSQEFGMCFEEHFLVKGGVTVIDEVVEFHSEYNSDKDEYTDFGGFENWEFSF